MRINEYGAYNFEFGLRSTIIFICVLLQSSKESLIQLVLLSGTKYHSLSGMFHLMFQGVFVYNFTLFYK